jgi:hypothetical protein
MRSWGEHNVDGVDGPTARASATCTRQNLEKTAKPVPVGPKRGAIVNQA